MNFLLSYSAICMIIEKHPSRVGQRKYQWGCSWQGITRGRRQCCGLRPDGIFMLADGDMFILKCTGWVVVLCAGANRVFACAFLFILFSEGPSSAADFNLVTLAQSAPETSGHHFCIRNTSEANFTNLTYSLFEWSELKFSRIDPQSNYYDQIWRTAHSQWSRMKIFILDPRFVHSDQCIRFFILDFT